MVHQLFGDDTERAGFIALFLKDFFHQPVFLRSGQSPDPAAFWPRHGVVWHQQEKPQGKPQ
ncbi:hypothetical protein LFZ32_04430 [Salmonella enterica subsp. enterica serovar Newport str. L0167]|nr:hypothetical protein LFZ32_04430 [Salmonella enterica subsp. enterica serovar Newport str. L0167]